VLRVRHRVQGCQEDHDHKRDMVRASADADQRRPFGV